MIQVKCIKKFRDKNNHIYGYRIQDKKGNIRDIRAEKLKLAIKSNRLSVANLTLTSDNRLVDTSDKNNTPMINKSCISLYNNKPETAEETNNTQKKQKKYEVDHKKYNNHNNVTKEEYKIAYLKKLLCFANGYEEYETYRNTETDKRRGYDRAVIYHKHYNKLPLPKGSYLKSNKAIDKITRELRFKKMISIFVKELLPECKDKNEYDNIKRYIDDLVEAFKDGKEEYSDNILKARIICMLAYRVLMKQVNGEQEADSNCNIQSGLGQLFGCGDEKVTHGSDEFYLDTRVIVKSILEERSCNLYIPADIKREVIVHCKWSSGEHDNLNALIVEPEKKADFTIRKGSIKHIYIDGNNIIVVPAKLDITNCIILKRRRTDINIEKDYGLTVSEAIKRGYSVVYPYIGKNRLFITNKEYNLDTNKELAITLDTLIGLESSNYNINNILKLIVNLIELFGDSELKEHMHSVLSEKQKNLIIDNKNNSRVDKLRYLFKTLGGLQINNSFRMIFADISSKGIQRVTHYIDYKTRWHEDPDIKIELDAFDGSINSTINKEIDELIIQIGTLLNCDETEIKEMLKYFLLAW